MIASILPPRPGRDCRWHAAERFLTETKSVTLAVEYETPVDPVAARGTVMMVGAFLACFFAW